jgi:hypothetical protein
MCYIYITDLGQFCTRHKDKKNTRPVTWKIQNTKIYKKSAAEVLSFIQTYCTNKRVMKENNGLPRNTNTKLEVVTTPPNECGLNDLKKGHCFPCTQKKPHSLISTVNQITQIFLYIIHVTNSLLL